MKPIRGLEDLDGFDLADAFDVEAAYDEHMRRLPRDNRQGVFHPSAVGMCQRKNYYEYVRAPAANETQPQSQERFDLGHKIHEILGDRFKGICKDLRKQGLTADVNLEVPFDKATDPLFMDFGLGGTTDGIMEVGGSNWLQRSILEFKSIKSTLFKDLKGKAKPNHLLQAHLYALRYNCGLIYFVYYSKDTSEKAFIPYVFDSGIADIAVEYFRTLKEMADRGEVPERDEQWFICSECEYQRVCEPSILTRKSNARKQAGLARSKFR